jgi:hypothetical protein
MAKQRRRWTLLLTVVVTLLISVPAAVWAGHQFTDVPNNHLFHTGISWMKDNGITVGCNPPTNNRYCPEDNVTRGEMATFMKRLAENQVVDAAELEGRSSTDYLNPVSGQGYDWFSGVGNISLAATGTPIVETIIAAPADGFLVVMGHAAVGNSPTNGSYYAIWIQLDDGSCSTTSGNAEPDNSVPGAVNVARDGTADDYSVAVNGIAPVSAGDHTVTLCGSNDEGDGDAFNASVIAQFSAVGSASTLTGVSSSGGGGADE